MVDAVVYVETSEESGERAVARLFGDLLGEGGGERAANTVAGFLEPSTGEVQTLAAIRALLPGVTAALAAEKPPADDLDAAFTVLANLAAKVPEAETGAAVDAIVSAITDGTGVEQLRLKGLFCLHNALPTAQGRSAAYLRIAKYAIAAGVAEAVLPAARRVETLLAEWGTGCDARAVYHAVSDVFRAANSPKEAALMLVKYLGTFQEGDAALAGCADDAVKAVADYVGSPDTFASDLLDLPAVRQLEKSNAPVYALLNVCLTGTLDGYEAWAKGNSAVLQKLGLSHDAIVSKMRLLSLAGLAGESGEIPYARVAEALHCEADEVEMWVVHAISVKLIDAKMDQLREVVHVTRCTDRVFGAEQWAELRTKLAGWKESIGAVKKMVALSKATAEAGPAALKAGVAPTAVH